MFRILMCLFKMHDISSASVCTSKPLGLHSLYSILPKFSFHFLCVSRCLFNNYADIVLRWSFFCEVPRVRLKIVWAELKRVYLISQKIQTKLCDSIDFQKCLPNCTGQWGGGAKPVKKRIIFSLVEAMKGFGHFYFPCCISSQWARLSSL